MRATRRSFSMAMKLRFRTQEVKSQSRPQWNEYSKANYATVTAITKVRFLQAWKRWRAMAVLDPADTFNE